jgi:ubiquitin carboxyl-terminal hydrolase 36/42
MVSKPQTSADRVKVYRASRGLEQKTSDKERQNNLRNRSRSLKKDFSTYSNATGMNPFIRNKGLRNFNVTCFMNSVFQAFSALKMFRNFLGSVTVSNEGDNNKSICLMQELFIELSDTSDDRQVLTPSGLVNKVYDLSPQFQKNIQQSALGSLDRFLELLYGNFNGLIIKDNNGNVKDCSQSINDIFGGHIRYQTTCPICGFITSSGKATFFKLPVQICHGINSVQDAISQFLAPEQLDKEQNWKCDGKCQRVTPGIRALTIVDCPKTLIVSLKRFQ